MGIEAKDNQKQLIQDVWKYLKPYKKSLLLSLSLMVIAVPLMNFHPLVWGIVADRLMDNTLTVISLLWWLVIMTVSYFAGLGIQALHSYFLERTGQAVIRDLRLDLFAKFQAQTIAYHKDKSTGELVARMTSDVDAMEQSVLQGMTSLLEEVVTFLIVASMVLWISPIVGSLSILPLAFAFIFIRMYNRKVKSIYGGVRKKLGNIGSFVQDRLAGVQVTQSFAQEEAEQNAFSARANGFYQSSIRASLMRNAYFPIVAGFGFINNLIMLGVGGWLILEGSNAFTIGALLAYRGFWWRLQSPIRTIAQTSDIVQRARAAAHRVMELLNDPIDIKNESVAQTSRKPNKGSIHFENVCFFYHPEKEILKNVSFEIKPGEFVAIAGSSGAGKSSLIHLIPRFYEVKGGNILVDGVDIRDYSLQDLRTFVGLVGQDNYLFDGTIEENIRYAVPYASDAIVRRAAIEANADKFITGFIDGYQTHVGQNGLKLSGGQRQRISLARTFITNPGILLLDEPTASVEPESEALIYESILRRRDQGVGTTLLVTHRIDLLRQSPRILFFDGGQLCGDGSHQELISRSSVYRDAYQRWEKEG
jgi:ABC-type multidrug transport system fused ATPase/permease subunit